MHTQQLIAELVDQALRLSGNAREEFLREAVGNDSCLRAEVEKLLVERLAPVSEAAATVATVYQDQSASRNEPGESSLSAIGRYRVIRLLGQGGFGRVYLAQDAELQRPVAIKVPRAERVFRPEDIETYLAEARILARLDHPNIVPVYDVGHTDDGLCYVVSKYIEGCDLHQRMKSSPLSLAESVRLLVDVAEAVDYAHRQHLIHRDIKPANILLGQAGQPFLVDFGLALRDEDFGTAARAGTPGYMSPEQSRGEGHRIDARSDIFSLGCVLYELGTGRRPFMGASATETLELIRTVDPAPLRELNPAIPEELERICLKALSKRAIDRHATAGALAEELRHFASSVVAWSGDHATTRGDQATTRGDQATAWGDQARPSGGGGPGAASPGVVPKGLRSFDSMDADFFLTLLPGPKDRQGLPDSLRFWKTRIESPDPDQTFRVGVIYGPSGCGKSSLVKAGLLPRLNPHVKPIYLEATPSTTEAGLLRALLRACPELPEDRNLVETLAAIRRERILPPGAKVLLVLDQFEQWLVGRPHYENTPLVDALRQCDGQHLQAIVLVRDDFWMALTRWMAALEIRIVEGENSAAVDLFTLAHARSVLQAFGRAYGALPPAGVALTSEQATFLDRSVAELAQEWKVIPVQLALFAEMVKARPWTPATLKAVGGMQGVGVAFLDEAFRSPTAPPGHRMHQRAAEAILSQLLPEAGATIKGGVRSESELRTISGYAERPAEFDDLMRILDGELRLITPTDPAIAAPLASTDSSEEVHYYQLTHDFLVQSVRDWVTRGKEMTRRGRAWLRLAERSAFWNANRANRYLPSMAEWANILLLTRSSRWSDAERRMMRRASLVHGLALLAMVALLGVLTTIGMTIAAVVHARELVPNLLVTELDHVPENVAALEHFRWWTDPELRRVLAESPDGSDRKLRASLALLPVDPSQQEYLFEQLRHASPERMLVLRRALREYSAVLTPRTCDLLRGMADGDPAMLPLAAVLADYAPDEACWKEIGHKVARALAQADFVSLKRWLDALRPARKHLKEPLASLYRADPKSENASKIADILSDYASDDSALAADLLLDAEPAQFGMLLAIASRNPPEAVLPWKEELARPEPAADEPARDHLAARQARAAIALLKVGADGEAVWNRLRLSPSPRCRSFLLELLKPMGIERDAIAGRVRAMPPGKARTARQAAEVLFSENDSIRRALVLALGEYDAPNAPAGQQEPLIAVLLDLYENDPDAGIHAAAEWTLRRWHQDAALTAADARLLGANRGDRRWYLSSEGLTFSVVDPPGEFIMGSHPDEPWRRVHEPAHRRLLQRRYAIASKEVTVSQFAQFLQTDPKRRKQFDRSEADPSYPQDNLSWFDAAAFCNWLSAREGLTPCYVPNKDGEFGPGMSVKPDALALSGYRLPTEAEWEYAARAGAATSRSYGNSARLLSRYAWSVTSSGDRLHPGGLLRPNDLGLFDVLGNVTEWTQNEARDYPASGANPAEDALDPGTAIDSKIPRVLRGGSYLDRDDDVRVMRRDRTEPGDKYPTYGVRPVRTVP